MRRIIKEEVVAIGGSEVADGRLPPGVPIRDILGLHVDVKFHSAGMKAPGEVGEVRASYRKSGSICFQSSAK